MTSPTDESRATRLSHATRPARAGVSLPMRETPVGCCPLSDARAVRVRISPSVRLTSIEAFTACQALADAEPLLRRGGHPDEAGALGDLFGLLEDRLTQSGPVRAELSLGRARTRARAS